MSESARESGIPQISGIQQINEQVHLVLAPNPGPMTLDGTNTWIVHRPGSDEALVIDPGPLLEEHQQSVANAVASLGARVALAVTTHHHLDHTEGVPRFAEITGCRVREAAHLTDGEVIEVSGVQLEVVATAGHTADSVSYLLRPETALFTGDTVLGRGTTVVAEPDGDLSAYLDSLQRLTAVIDAAAITELLPGHGPIRTDAAGTIDSYRRHRLDRLDQVRRALTGGAATQDDPVEAVLQAVYAEVSPEVWPAARQSIRAQLAYLEAAS